MKWLLYALAGIAGVIAICLIVLLMLGGMRGESRHVASIDIAKPVGTVFMWVTQPAKLRSWVGWVVEIRDLTPDHRGIGAKQLWVLEDRNHDNQRMEIASQVTRYEQDRLVETRVEAPAAFTGEVSYELQAMDASRTRLTYRAWYRYDGWLAKLLEPVISRSAQQKLEEDMQRLKQRAEAESVYEPAR
jgi:uncharacterized membrane protein